MLQHIKVTLLFTYSGIDNKDIEPYPSHVAAESLKLMSAPIPRRYRTVLYWRPLVPGLNDSPEHLDRAYELSQHADATVFTGLFYRGEIADYYKANGLPEPYDETARRKIVPETLERRVLSAFAGLRRRCSARPRAPCRSRTDCRTTTVTTASANCATSARSSQLDLCRARTACRLPSRSGSRQRLPEARGLVVVDITERAAVVSGLAEEQPRYYLQHALGFQVHDVRHPHHDASARSGGYRMEGTPSKMTDWTSLRYVVVDVEGNGQQPPDLVELAVVPIVGGVIGEPVSWLVRPQRPITPIAARIHGLTNEDVADAPSLRGHRGDVLLALTARRVVAHNAHVDVGVLRRELRGWECPEVFDTLKLARRLLPGQMSYRLGALVEAFKLAEGLPTAWSRTGPRTTRW